MMLCSSVSAILFLSTPSARRATSQQKFNRRSMYISIHALREEGDRHDHTYQQGLEHFYPRPPRGGRRGSLTAFLSLLNFYPRPPRGGRHSHSSQWASTLSNFYPRPPRGGRRENDTGPWTQTQISIHALREEGDGLGDQWFQDHQISIHALREEGDYCFFNKFFFKVISIHALREEGDSRLS